VYDVDDVDDHVDLKCVLPHQLLQDNCNIGNKAVQLGEASTEENEVQITFDSTV
jgi:hypothetical protein